MTSTSIRLFSLPRLTVADFQMLTQRQFGTDSISVSPIYSGRYHVDFEVTWTESKLLPNVLSDGEVRVLKISVQKQGNIRVSLTHKFVAASGCLRKLPATMRILKESTGGRFGMNDLVWDVGALVTHSARYRNHMLEDVLIDNISVANLANVELRVPKTTSEPLRSLLEGKSARLQRVNILLDDTKGKRLTLHRNGQVKLSGYEAEDWPTTMDTAEGFLVELGLLNGGDR